VRARRAPGVLRHITNLPSSFLVGVANTECLGMSQLGISKLR
jgi:hypothetical protein